MGIDAPVIRQLVAYNARDIDAFVLNFHEDCVVEDGAGKELMRGRKAMRESYGRMFAASPDLHCRVVSRIVLSEYVLDEERVTGRAGIEGEGHVVAVYRVENDEITHVRFLR
ncbi:MAG: nuclear transport factor 2 family protein [Promicromonosporaceae bacterium]|nr:nuclear transport factor 2 family protein [Promicromonosporaceae bacterium]